MRSGSLSFDTQEEPSTRISYAKSVVSVYWNIIVKNFQKNPFTTLYGSQFLKESLSPIDYLKYEGPHFFNSRSLARPSERRRAVPGGVGPVPFWPKGK